MALRVKPAYTAQNFSLQSADHSVLDPLGPNQPGRVRGYKIHAANLVIEQDQLRLVNQLDPQRPPVDGFSLLKRLTVAQDPAEEYLGLDLQLQLYNSFHTDATGAPIITPNHTKLVRRDSASAQVAGYYHDLDDRPIYDANGKSVPILIDKQSHLLAAPLASEDPTRSVLLGNNHDGSYSFRSSSPSDPLVFSFFKNQRITLAYQGAIGQGSSTEPDFVLDQSRMVDLSAVISAQIKFAIANEQNIFYRFGADQFLPNQIRYVSGTPEFSQPLSGFAKLATPLALIRRAGRAETTIGAAEPLEAVRKLQAALDGDFNHELKFRFTHWKARGGTTVYEGANIYQLTNLANGDRIRLEIVSANPDLVYTSGPAPLVITIKGLTELAPTPAVLQHLRVEQGGLVDGHGSFRVLISDPQQPDQAAAAALRGWQFLVRV